MKTIMARSPHDSSFSKSRRYFHWKRKVDDEDDGEEILTFRSSSQASKQELKVNKATTMATQVKVPNKKLSIMAVSKLRWAFTVFGKSRSHPCSHGSRMVGTIFGHRRGHVHFGFQDDPKLNPSFLVKLTISTSILVREMASGLVRIALECDKKSEKKGVKLTEEPIWRTYCNGKKCGYAMRRACGPEEWKVLETVCPISMGAGVIPASASGNGAESEGELMYVRAKFERVVGSKDSEAFYMMSPDANGGPELSIYLLRV